MNNRITLKSGRERSVKFRHPWIFSGAVERIEGKPSEGDIVGVFTKSGERLGFGHFGEKNIVVRMLSFGKQEIDADFWKERMEAALQLRVALGLTCSKYSSAYRVFNAEGDGVPGLVIDQYGHDAVIEIHSKGVWNAREQIVPIFKKISGSQNVIVRRADTAEIHGSNGVRPESEFVASFIENDIKFTADLIKGQKTGFFLDQRENRKLIRSYCAGKKVLNMFAYSGGFSINALYGGASEVHSVELSKEALVRLEEHLKLNGFSAKHYSFTEDCFKFLQDGKEKYDLIVLDPPAFAKHRSAKSPALRGYESLNALALKRAAPNALIFTFSCSLFVTNEEFREAVYHGATQSGRAVQVLSELRAGLDHPVSLYHREGEYLKGLLLRIE